MADYYPLLTRALDSLADSSVDTRRTVYERARSALLGQLRSLDPPLSDQDIARERKALEDAIGRLEEEHGGDALAAPAPETAPAVAAAAAAAPTPEAKPVRLKARTPKPRAAPDANEAPQPAAAPSPPRGRPRIETVAERSGLDPARRRSLILGSVLLVLVSMVAVAAWLLRDQPADIPQTAVTEGAPSADAQGKLADRVGGERAPGAAPPAAATATTGSAGPARSDVPIAQRAVFYEENTTEGQGPKSMTGRAVWRLDAVNAGQGQPLETVIRANVDVPEAGLTLDLTIRRNLDGTLPASHTVELVFTTKGENRAVRDVGLLQFKAEEALRGTAVAGLPVPVKDNLFLIGLSNVKGDLDRNMDLLLHRNWIDIPLRLVSGKRAVLSFEKGVPGDRVVADAFSQWR
jgi:hypothetical protein